MSLVIDLRVSRAYTLVPKWWSTLGLKENLIAVLKKENGELSVRAPARKKANYLIGKHSLLIKPFVTVFF